MTDFDDKAPPYIEKPERLDEAEGGMCWITAERACGPDCVAFNTEELDEHGMANTTPNRCLVLVYGGQVASGVLALVKIGRFGMNSGNPMPPRG